MRNNKSSIKEHEISKLLYLVEQNPSVGLSGIFALGFASRNRASQICNEAEKNGFLSFKKDRINGPRKPSLTEKGKQFLVENPFFGDSKVRFKAMHPCTVYRVDPGALRRGVPVELLEKHDIRIIDEPWRLHS